ncbi:TlpA disulfide reductase family protein [Colwellia sp. E2M01]|uniref:TlpA family protein disulfide reductase n=1 Tax=Colwellia sp. E2M01 TaxID=2841561 RepID=UPI001C083B22|nr:TlpA disulfide reductase family protein [Colwellia sp. E2M01]MBU2870667.1 TlpA family protein disulfide reductase [Colwellia sp. E2M01]
MIVKKMLCFFLGFVFCLLSAVSHAEQIKNMILTGLNDTKSTTFKALEGDYIYVDFWASWCGPCKKSFPFMVELQNTFKNKNFKIVAISVDEEKSDAVEFLDDNMTNFEVYLDVDGVIATQFELPGMPTSYLIDPKGNIISTHVGFHKKSEEAILAELNAIFNK